MILYDVFVCCIIVVLFYCCVILISIFDDLIVVFVYSVFVLLQEVGHDLRSSLESCPGIPGIRRCAGPGCNPEYVIHETIVDAGPFRLALVEIVVDFSVRGAPRCCLTPPTGDAVPSGGSSNFADRSQHCFNTKSR